MGDWHRKSTKQALEGLTVSQKDGLSTAEVKKRQEKYGLNQLESGSKINPFTLFISQFKDVLIIILLIAAAVSFGVSFLESGEETTRSSTESNKVCNELVPGVGAVAEGDCIEVQGISFCDQANFTNDETEICETTEAHGGSAEYTEAILIFAIVLAIAIIGFLNEYKAERTVEALKKLVGHNAKVRRDGKIVEVPAVELVPGDIVLIDEGQKIPADIRLLSVNSLQINEASLTGESLPISKNTLQISKAAALGDQKNMTFSGTIATTGNAEGVVVSTGAETELGKIAHMVNEVEEEQTPMQRKLDDLGKKLGVLILGICILVFIVIFFGADDAVDKELAQRLIFAFTVAVALAVAAIPEGLSFVVRISLALGARRMASKNALVRKLSAVEALGSTDVIASDKTGTLTKGEMTVRKIYTNGSTFEVEGSGYELHGEFEKDGKKITDLSALIPILRAGLLANNSHIKGGKVIGDPTEGALVVSAAKAGLFQDQLGKKFPRVDEVPFSSERKLMTSVNKMDGKHVVLTKGAPDIMLDLCDRVLVNGKVRKLDAAMKKEIVKVNQSMAQEALRVLGFAYKEVSTKPKGAKEIESKLIFLGLQGMMDPPREEVKQVMHRIHAEAGMRVLMITGDYIETAKAVAAEIGIEGEAITGEELDKLSQEQFEKDVENISVYARVNPEHKIRIVQALKKHGHQVAMTGDGVNDAPAIKAADIGIAMGINGTDAAKEASDLILLDDQFLTIITAVEEGRGIFDNVRKFVSYLLGANIAEVLVVLGGIIILRDPILTATQLLFINIVTDGLPAIALGSDPAEKGIMRYKPHHFQDAIINKPVWIEMFIYGFLVSAILLAQFAIVRSQETEFAAVSAAFTALVIFELVRLVILRTNYRIPWFSNPWLSVALVASFIAQMAIMYVDSFASLFEIEPISMLSWEIIASGSIGIFVIMKLSRKILEATFDEIKPRGRTA